MTIVEVEQCKGCFFLVKVLAHPCQIDERPYYDGTCPYRKNESPGADDKYLAVSFKVETSAP